MKYLTFLALMFAVSCGKQTQYSYYDEGVAPISVDKRIYPASLLSTDNKVDILFVIDNSGSMAPIQDNVIRNSRIFLEQFSNQSYVSWKIGLVSTDKGQAPFLGFDSSFDSSLITANDPASFERTVSTFQEAVSRLGTSGDSSEYVFYNTRRVFDLYNGTARPSFLRKNSHLVVIMITDEKEQSEYFGVDYKASNFFNVMSRYKGGNKILRFYGAFGLKDLEGCSSTGYDNFFGSEYEKIIQITGGVYMSACTSDFGTELAKIGKDITTLVGPPSLLLKERPVVDTLKVYYKDKMLNPGPKNQGGKWFYEEKTNTITFYSTDFIQDFNNDTFRIEFDIDDGISRD